MVGVSKSSTHQGLSLTRTAALVGSPIYMSPEQIKSSRDVDARTDIWSLGTILAELIETNFSTVRIDDNLKNLIKVISTSTRNTYPVINEKRELLGLIQLDNIRGIIFTAEKPEEMPLEKLMTPPAAIIKVDENLHDVLRKFDETGLWNLPVVHQNQYMGFVSKSSVLTKYRAELLRSV